MAHARSLRRLGPEMAGTAAFLLLVASVPSWIVYETWADRIETAALWSVAGPDCPVVAPAAELFGAKGPYTFSYGGAQFSRRFGHVSCAAPQGGGLIPGEGIITLANNRVHAKLFTAVLPKAGNNDLYRLNRPVPLMPPDPSAARGLAERIAARRQAGLAR